MLSFIYKFHFILYSVIQWDKERERLRVWERVREKNLEGGPDCRRKPRGWRAPLTGAEAEAQTAERWADDRSTVYDVDVDLWANVDLRWGVTIATTTTSSLRRWQRRRDHPWVNGLLGLILVCVLGIFFFFFLINTSVLCVWFVEFCVWFAFVLGFDFSASDDATWWDFARRQRRDGFNFSFSVFFFYFLVENPWAYRERATCNGLAVGLVLLFFFIFSDFSSNYFWVFFFFFAWK